jgi:hypothetical protein
MLHIGRKAPKGFREAGKGIHLGQGCWILPIELIGDNEPPEALERATGQRGAIEWMNPRDLEADGTPRDYREPQEKP